MKIESVNTKTIILRPESLQEAGDFFWIAKRLAGRSVVIEFDTLCRSSGLGDHQAPMVWISETDKTTVDDVEF